MCEKLGFNLLLVSEFINTKNKKQVDIEFYVNVKNGQTGENKIKFIPIYYVNNGYN